ncbi:MAG: metal ABC transporter permease [Phycisphaerae bacterium]|nr:metal ABC transporter permease [Phycisphaerae bacterium]
MRRTSRIIACAVASIALIAPVQPSRAAEPPRPEARRSITDTTWQWPTAAQFRDVFRLADYNTRVVVIGVTLLGLASGIVGTFAYLRKRALMGDALGHATLPGIAAAFLLLETKSLPILLIGATLSGVLGVLAVAGLRSIPRIKEDAAIGIVLSVFFGIGMVLMAFVQQMRTGHEAGLQNFIYGKAASMLERDARLIAASALVVIAGSLLLYKEFRLICFDQPFAGAQGYPVVALDLAMMALVVVTTVVGLQAVGLILVVAMLIVPPAAARFWTDRLFGMTLLAGLFGALSGWLGASLSALLPRLPTGAIIVVCAGAFFVVSMFFAPQRGILAGLWRQAALRRRIAMQHLLRALAEFEELHGRPAPVSGDELRSRRRMSHAALRAVLARAMRRNLVVRDADGRIRLTDDGRVEATRVLRNHRLWEIYLIRYADIAPSHVDRDADEIEHVLSEQIIRELEASLQTLAPIPPSPHVLGDRP